MSHVESTKGSRERGHLWRVGALSVGTLILGASALTLPLYWVYLGSTMAIAALVARSVGVVTNLAGMLTLCQMSFAAIGAWVTARILVAWPSSPFPAVVIVAGIAAGLVGLGMGALTARIRGVEFAVVTLGFAAALEVVLRQHGFPGVSDGTAVIPEAPFDDPRGFFVLCWIVLAVAQGLVVLIRRTRLGIGWEAVRSGERGGAALGVPIDVAKASAMGVGAMCAGMAGALFAGQYGLSSTKSFGPMVSMSYLVSAVLFGAGLFSGALAAGVATVALPELLRRVGWPLDVASVLLGIGAFDILRRGNGGLADQFRARLQNRRFATTRLNWEPPDPTAEGSVPTAEPEPDPDDACVDDEGRDNEGSVHPGLERKPALSVSNLTVKFGPIVVLGEVSIDVAGATVHALIGPNGAGKSTFVDAITGFVTPEHGTVHLDGARIDGFGASRRARAGLRRTFQTSNAVEGICVGDYLGLAARFGLRREPIPVHVLISTFGLPGPEVPIRLLNSASRRMLEVAGTLAGAPAVVVLDEPAAGLDATERNFLADTIRSIPRIFGASVVVIEHDIEFIQRCAVTVSVLHAGRVVVDGPTETVLQDPEVTGGYLVSVPATATEKML